MEGVSMSVAIPLARMTTADKLRALEEIWDDLQRTPESVPPPAWHAEVLCAREARVREGHSSFKGWESARRRIRARAR
jgi:hypothetical protein